MTENLLLQIDCCHALLALMLTGTVMSFRVGRSSTARDRPISAERRERIALDDRRRNAADSVPLLVRDTGLGQAPVDMCSGGAQ